mmetsp:Transcript_8665/g.14691  ORF Transcript_8665/g.14691 Transcript_8665/m.14691 type:complete len:155 (+) Transcript_8665:2361-2825(+)
MDQTIRIWDLRLPNYQEDPHIIYDHDDEIVSADIREKDGLLATMDLQGIILLRRISGPGAEPDVVLHTIDTIPKELNDYGRLVLNAERMDDEGELIILLNDQLILVASSGRQIDAICVSSEHQFLQADTTSVIDSKLLYKALCKSKRMFVTQQR